MHSSNKLLVGLQKYIIQFNSSYLCDCLTSGLLDLIRNKVFTTYPKPTLLAALGMAPSSVTFQASPGTSDTHANLRTLACITQSYFGQSLVR